jgi:hypothetical protein
MYMAIDEAGHQRLAAQIDLASASGKERLIRHRFDQAVPDEDMHVVPTFCRTSVDNGRICQNQRTFYLHFRDDLIIAM